MNVEVARDGDVTSDAVAQGEDGVGRVGRRTADNDVRDHTSWYCSSLRERERGEGRRERSAIYINVLENIVKNLY